MELISLVTVTDTTAGLGRPGVPKGKLTGIPRRKTTDTARNRGNT